jgi:peptidoglycan/LPS O-acetylase OafA/YrhL
MKVERIAVLDGVRGLAIALVMYHHFFQNYHSAANTGLDRVVFGLASAGWSGVDLFFVLSGFLITGILYDSRHDPRYYRNFYGRRTLRIFPLYYAALVLFLVVLPAINHPQAQTYVADFRDEGFWLWTYLANFRIAYRGEWYAHLIPNVFWSLAIEEQFYLVWPAVVLLCARRTLVAVCAALIVLALVVRIGLWWADAAPIVSFVLTFARMDCLALGALIALAARGDGGLRTLVTPAKVVGGGALALVALYMMGTGGLDWDHPFVNTLGFTVLAALFGSLLVLGMTVPASNPLRTALDNDLMRTFGKYSYAMYVVHGPANVVVKQFVFDPAAGPLVMGSIVPAVTLYAVLSTALTLAIAWVSWHTFERHVLSYQRHFRTPALPLPHEVLTAGGHQGVPSSVGVRR